MVLFECIFEYVFVGEMIVGNLYIGIVLVYVIGGWFVLMLYILVDVFEDV